MVNLTKAAGFAVLAALIASPSWADDAANKKVLRDAVQGAITGAVAAEAAGSDGAPPGVEMKGGKESAASAVEKADKKTKAWKKAKKDGKDKDKSRPHGWDQGKKTGWGEGDVPPGLREEHGQGKKNKKK